VRPGRQRAVLENSTVKAKIKVKMRAMSLTFVGSVSILERDESQHVAALQVKSRESGGQGHANADVRFTVGEGGGAVETKAQITSKAASMGEGVINEVLDALIRDFCSSFEAA
jgi:carbon monoxide dehydrogenase subunit G